MGMRKGKERKSQVVMNNALDRRTHEETVYEVKFISVMIMTS
jgi:hypothetical protein